MLDSIKHLKDDNYDCFFFLPTDEEGQIHFQGSNYIDPGTKLDGSEMGDCYHVILFKESDEGEVMHLDKFDAILTAPLEYISRLIPDDWYGVVAKKTTTSHILMDDTFDKIKGSC